MRRLLQIATVQGQQGIFQEVVISAKYFTTRLIVMVSLVRPKQTDDKRQLRSCAALFVEELLS